MGPSWDHHGAPKDRGPYSVVPQNPPSQWACEDEPYGRENEYPKC